MEARKLPEVKRRVETGVVQFGNDWPGIFIRGDNAAAYATYLYTILRAAEKNEPLDNVAKSIYTNYVMGLVTLLRSCNVNPAVEELWANEHANEQK